MLKVFNTLSAQKEQFIPIVPNRITMYVCGMTVYDYCHIGHARVLVVFDIINRYLRHIYGEDKVVYVRNITDIDDKIIQRAIENKEDIQTLTTRFIQAMHEDADALGVKRPDIEPLATKHMPQIIQMIQTLVDKNVAYQAANGDVFFQIENFPQYGKLAKKNLDDLRSGHRVDIDQAKKNPLDFVLWKSAKADEPSWDSPWGKGRPGWHIECSAMSTFCLGNHIDIHGGGLDLQFPHHENEIAQSEACTDEHFVNYWLHNGFVKVDDEKMSKSLGNFFIIRDVLKIYAPEVIRYFILNSHYRSPLNYSNSNLDKAKSSLSSLYNTLSLFKDDITNTFEPKLQQHQYVLSFQAALDDDFNTPMAIAVLFEISKAIHKLTIEQQLERQQLLAIFKYLSALLGLLQDNAEDFLHYTCDNNKHLTDEEIEAMIQLRTQAKTEKNWAESDRIRDSLQQQGISLEDNAEGTRWRR